MLTRVALVLVVLAPLTGCKKKKDDAAAPPAPPPVAQPAAKPTGAAGHATGRSATFPRVALAQVAIEDVVPLLPALPGAVSLGEPVGQAGGRQVRQSFCLAGADLPSLAAEVKAGMDARGFTTTPPQPRGKADRPRVVVSGQKDELRLSANVITSANPACSGKAEVLYTFHRVKKGAIDGARGGAPRAPAAPAAPGGAE